MSSALDILATLRLEDGRPWIDTAYDFQLEDARAVIAGEAPYNFLTRARGSSKTTDLAAVALAMLLAAEKPARFYWLAADAEQGALALDAIQQFVSRSPHLGDRVKVQARRVITDGDSRMDLLPADAPGAWGLNPDAIFVDELANWTDGPAARRLWEAASSAIAKRVDSRLVVLTTSGSPDHFSRKVLDAALVSGLWRVNEIRGPAPWADPARLAEQKARLPESVYRQLFENEWTAVGGSFLDPAVIDMAFVLDGPTTRQQPGQHGYVAALDLGLVNDRTVFAIGHRTEDRGGEPHVELDRMEVWSGSRLRPVNLEVVEDYIAAAHSYYGFRLRFDPWQSMDLSQRLQKRGIRADAYTFSETSKQRLAATLLQTLNAGHLRLYEAEGLREELIGLRVKQNPSGHWSFDHTRRGHDDRAVALAMLTVAALENSTYGRAMSLPSPFEPGGQSRLREAQARLAGKSVPPIPTASVKRGEERTRVERVRRAAFATQEPWENGKTGAEILDRIRNSTHVTAGDAGRMQARRQLL
jgi:hypothetical protein